jgi:cytochrome c
VTIAILIGLTSGCTDNGTAQGGWASTLGYAASGTQILVDRRRGSCHDIPGIHDAHGVFGPPLGSFARLTVPAGNFPKLPAYLVPWLMSPKSLKPRTAAPELGISQQQARDVAAYFYTLQWKPFPLRSALRIRQGSQLLWFLIGRDPSFSLPCRQCRYQQTLANPGRSVAS